MFKPLIRKYIYKSVIVIACFFAFTNLYAQEEKPSIRQNYQLNDSIKGIRMYDFKVDGKDTIFDGNFRFKSIHFNEDNNRTSRSIGYIGVYNDGKKNGKWVFSRKKLKKELPFIVEGLKVVYNATGTEFKIVGNFEEGMASGDWTAIFQNFENSEPTDSLYYFQTSFKEDRMSGSISGNSEKIALVGNFNEEGLLDGKWRIRHKINGEYLDEYRDFENGVFKSHYFEFQEKKYLVEHVGFDTSVDREEENWVEIGVNEGYFEIFQFTNLGLEEKNDIPLDISIRELSTNANRFLENSLLSFGFYDGFNVWEALQGNDFFEYGKFKVRKYEYTNKEINAIESIQESVSDIQEFIDYYSNNTAFEIGVVSFEELAKNVQVIKAYEGEVDAMKKFAQKVSTPIFQFVKRDKVLPFLIPNHKFKEELNYKFQDEERAFSFAFPEQRSAYDYDLVSIAEYYKELRNALSDVLEESKKIESDIEKQEGLSEREAELIKKRDRLTRLFNGDENADEINQYHEKIADAMIKQVEAVFNQYAKSSLDEKQDNVQDYIKCYNQYFDLYERFLEIPSKKDRVKEVYTRTVFNPFMMTDISEISKERVFNAYNDILHNYVVELIEENLSCDEVENRLENLDILHKAMLEIREKDTKDEERQLRREKSPTRILDILEIELNK